MILNLQVFNRALLLKWWDKLFINPQRQWKTIIDLNYYSDLVSPINASINRLKISPFWRNILKVAHLMSAFTSVSIGNGESTSFWEDKWMDRQDSIDLKMVFPTLYWLANDSGCSVASFINKSSILDNFRQPLLDQVLQETKHS